MTLISRYSSWLVASSTCFILQFALAIVLVSGNNTLAASNTVFLPLKINAPDSANVRQKADDSLRKNLQDKGYTFLERLPLEETLNYRTTWPPSPKTLTIIAEQNKVDYVALGSLTLIGNLISIDFMVFDILTPQTPHSSYRDGLTIADLDDGIEQTVNEVLNYSNRNHFIATISPAGNKRIDSGAILVNIKTRPNTAYNSIQLRQDLKAVYAMGYFNNVEIESKDTPKGKEIIFRVTEKPVINKVTISGTDEIEEQEIRDVANINPNTILNSAQLNKAVLRIQELYKEKGFHNTKVVADLKQLNPDDVDVNLQITEGKKIFIENISFSGNISFDDDELGDVIETSTRDWLSWFTDSGILKADILRQDTSRLAAFYHNKGFIESKVGDPAISRDGNALTIVLPIKEGERFRVGTVSLTGDLILEKDVLLAMLKIRDEKFLNRQVLRDDTLKITDLYAEHGYAYAEIHPSIKKSENGKRVDIALRLDKGPLVHFNRVEIIGNTRTRDNVIRRDVTIEEGGTFSSKAIRASTQKLQRLGFFEEVNLRPQPGLNDEQMDVVIDVKERSTGQFSVGAGYSSTDFLMFMAEIAENNLLGTGNRLSLSANISGTSARYNLAFTDPRLLDSHLSAGVDLFNWEREYDDYTKDSNGGALRFGHPFFEKVKIYYNYSYSDTTLKDVSEDAAFVIRESQDIHITSAVSLSLVRDTRNRYFAPNSGSRNKISVKYAGGPLSGDAAFTKIEASSSWYFPLPLDCVFRVNGSIGQAFENEDGKLPVYEHFYLGGLKSIRGFKSTHVSPKDPETGERIGGDKMWYTNFEIIFPLLVDAGLRGVVFTDFGNVYEESEDWQFDNSKKAVGLGIRWLSPMGPLRLEWGYNLDPEEDEEDTVWDFSIGGVF